MKVIRKSKDACKAAGEETDYHVPDVRKTIPMPIGAEKVIDEVCSASAFRQFTIAPSAGHNCISR